MPFISVIIGSVRSLCIQPPCSQAMFVFGGSKSGTCGIKLVLRPETVPHTKTRVFPLRTGLYIQSSPTSLEIEIRQLKIRIPACRGFFLGRSRRIISFSATVFRRDIKQRFLLADTRCQLGIDQTVHSCRQFESKILCTLYFVPLYLILRNNIDCSRESAMEVGRCSLEHFDPLDQ